jgi:hypothetical protein
MKLKYTGPKEMISAHGINFKDGKDDKYVYVYPALQIHDAIHHNYEEGVVYTYNIEGKRLTDDEVLAKILSFRPSFEETLKEKVNEIEHYLDEEIEHASQHKEYNEEEQKVYKNNLVIMKSYRKQREINKIIYNLLIEIIVDDIFEHKLKIINAPFNERYWHILQTIQGELSHHHKRSIGSVLDTVHKDNDLITITLKINSIGK